MSFINWGHETPEQREIRRKMEERMLFEQASYNAAVAAAAAGAGGKGNYVLSGRSSLTSFYENDEYKYYTYNFETDTLNTVYSTGINSNDFSDRMYVLQDSGFVLRYRNGTTGEYKYIFTDINGKAIKQVSYNQNEVRYRSLDYGSGVYISEWHVDTNDSFIANVFDGKSVKSIKVDDIFVYPWGYPDYEFLETASGVYLRWRSKDGTTDYLGLIKNGSVEIVDTFRVGVHSWRIDYDGFQEFLPVLITDWNTGQYLSFKVFAQDGSVAFTQDLSGLDHDNVRRSSFYGRNKYFFILSGNGDNSADIIAYDYIANSVTTQNVANGVNLSIDEYYQYKDAYYPAAQTNYDNDGIIGVTLRSDLLLIFWNDIDGWYDGYGNWYHHMDEMKVYTLFDGDTQFYSHDVISQMDTINLDSERMIRSFSENQAIVIDGFQWNVGGQTDQYLKAFATYPEGESSTCTFSQKVGRCPVLDKFFLGNKLFYQFYDTSTDPDIIVWKAIDKDLVSNEYGLNVSTDSNHYRTHDTMVIFDYDYSITYYSNRGNGHGFNNLNIETEVWYNRIFLSDNNGYGDISPTTELSYYPNNTGWGSIVLLHDTGVDEPDYGKAITITRDQKFQYTLPMVYGNSWYGELGNQTFLFAWADSEGGWTSNLYDLRGNILSTAKISDYADYVEDISIWNLNDRATISLVPDSRVNEYYHIYFTSTGPTSVNVGSQDYWWENDFPAWYW